MLSSTQLTTPSFTREPDNVASGTKAKARAARKSPKVGSKKPRNEKKAKLAPKSRGGSKQDRVLALLRHPNGATLDVLVKATGWQRHSIRGFLAGTVRKKLKLPLRSDKIDGTRTYRVGSRKPSEAGQAGGSRLVR